MRRRAVGVLVVIALGLAGCGVSTESKPRALPPEAAGVRTTQTPAETGSDATRFTALWFVADGDLIPVDRQIESAVTAQDKIVSLEVGPTQEELDAGMRTAVASVVPDVPLVVTADAAGVAVEAGPGQISVVLSDEFASLPSGEQLLALGQVVLTLTGGTSQSVLFVDNNGNAVGVPLPDGRLVNRPVTARDYRTMRS